MNNFGNFMQCDLRFMMDIKYCKDIARYCKCYPFITQFRILIILEKMTSKNHASKGEIDANQLYILSLLTNKVRKEERNE